MCLRVACYSFVFFNYLVSHPDEFNRAICEMILYILSLS